MLNWTSDKETWELQARIARRAVHLAGDLGVVVKQCDMLMDIDACHSNGCPLKLQELLEADDENFGHDVFGIRGNLDRKTGQLLNCFVPRYADTSKGTVPPPWYATPVTV